MSALQKLMEALNKNHKEMEDFSGCEYFYLNGEKMEILFHDVKPPSPIPLSFIREHIKDSVPEDFIFLNDKGEKINKEDEEKLFTNEEGVSKLYYIFSDILYSQKKYEPKNIILDFNKLEEKEQFIIYEYPNKEIKDEEEFCSILLFGDHKENLKFINGFLNYLYEVKKEDNFRLKFEDIDKNDPKNANRFSKIYNIKHDKGNFRYYSFDFSTERVFTFVEIMELEKVINNKHQEIHVDFIVYNKIDYTYEKRIRNKLFNREMKDIGRQLSQTKCKDIKSSFFFAGPNMIYSDLMYELRTWIIDAYGYNRPENAYDRSRIDLKENYKDALLYYCFCDYDAIYETKNEKLEICEFNRIMDGFSKFHIGLSNAPKKNQFKKLRQIYLSLIKIYQPMGLKYNAYLKNKFESKLTAERKENLEPNMIQLEKVQLELEFYNQRNSEIKDFITEHKEKILADHENFFIPYPTKKESITKHPDSKTTMCSLCKYNCHTDCTDFFKNFCKAFDFKFDCKVCPNRCPASKHFVVNYDMPKTEYKTIDELFPNSYTSAINKVNHALSMLEKEEKELYEKLSFLRIDIGAMKEVTDTSKINMKKIIKELNDEIEKFITNYVYNFKVEDFYEIEVFKIFMYSFFRLDYFDENTK